ncbi:hypothetical protein [Endozoicomonas sp.]|uniref:hypothetical protein n=1 Tax=Endozoicomonas sp. TaxID=1892382 RepID=UPI00383AC3FE
MIILNEKLYSSLCPLLADSGTPHLLNSASEYRAFRKLIAEANSASRAWLQEPDAEAAVILRKNLFGAWQECHHWLLTIMNNNALWSPEWLGWLAYTSLYIPESMWQSFSFSFLLLDHCLEQTPVDLSGDIQKSFNESLDRLAAMVSDKSTEPLLLSPMMETKLLNNLSLREIKADSPGQHSPDSFSTDNFNSLQSLAVPLDKLPEHFNRFGRTLPIKKIKSVISDTITVLSQCLPTQQSAEEEITADCLGDDKKASSGHPKTMNRDFARDNLQNLITFFRQTEPHSPVSWQLETALNWLDLSFPELLFRMTGEQQELHQDICRRLGMVDTALIIEKPDD